MIHNGSTPSLATMPSIIYFCSKIPICSNLFQKKAWKTHPRVPTQCPDPNHRVRGTCTMHASSMDLSVTLHALGKNRASDRAHILSYTEP